MRADFSQHKVVPWSCDAEWKYVFDLLYHEDTEKRQLGVDMVQIWKVRTMGTCSLSTSINVTADLVQAVLCFQTEGDTCRTRLCLSSALVRFVSLLSDVEQTSYEKKAMRVVCESIGIPAWITSLRHSSAHAQLPTSNLMALGAETCLEFIKDRYWFPQWLIIFELQNQTELKLQKLITDWLTRKISHDAFLAALGKQKPKSIPEKKYLLGILLKNIFRFPKEFCSILSEVGCKEAMLHLGKLTGFANFLYQVLTADFICENSAIFLDIMKCYGPEIVRNMKESEQKEVFRRALKSGEIEIIKMAVISCQGCAFASEDAKRVICECFEMMKTRETEQNPQALRNILSQLSNLESLLAKISNKHPISDVIVNRDDAKDPSNGVEDAPVDNIAGFYDFAWRNLMVE